MKPMKIRLAQSDNWLPESRNTVVLETSLFNHNFFKALNCHIKTEGHFFSTVQTGHTNRIVLTFLLHLFVLITSTIITNWCFQLNNLVFR